MTDYHPLIARAVDGLERSTGEARRALYERARSALVTQLRGVDPPLSESEITKERLALEDAIRKVEADAARKARAEPREQRPPAAPPLRRERPPADAARMEPRRSEAPADAGRLEARRAEPPLPPRQIPAEPSEHAPPRAPAPTARERLLNARSPIPAKRDGGRNFRDVIGDVHDLGGATAKAAQSARETRDSYGAYHPSNEDAEPAAFNDFGTEGDADDWGAEHYDPRQPRSREPSYHHDHADDVLHPARHPLPSDDEHVPPRPARDYRGLVKLAVALIILGGLLATISWQWPHIIGLYHSIAQIGARQQPSPASRETSEPKFAGRVPQEQSGGQAPAAGAPGSQTAPAVAQRVVLYEEDSNDPQGKRYVGSVIWRTETVSPGPGLAPELAVRADVEIPERHITMTWSLRRNTDQALPASHTIEILFNLPADFPGGGIANVPGVLMKQSEQARGTPLAGLAVKVTNGFFLIGLSAVDTDMQRNIQLLKDRPWFDIPIVYTNGGRAILALEKGPPGDRAFADAFAAWEKK
jgi:hypothetical protein